MRIIVISAIVILSCNTFAQRNIDTILAEVEKNNTTLSAFRQSVDAEKIGNKTGLSPQNPEMELNFLWGNPMLIGNRTDFSIKQSFDFPTVYAYKKRISNLKNEQAELEYEKLRNKVLYQTHLVCVKLTFYNALKVKLNNRHANALKVADAYKTKFSAGDVSILDYNKAHLNLVSISQELESNEIERYFLLSELATLNGGNTINFTDSEFALPTIPADFEQWVAQAKSNNPRLQWVNQEVAISEKQVKLNYANSLPKFYGGFMSEKVAGQQFQGVTVGITIPLWENKNTVKYARAQAIALQSVEADAMLQFYNSMKATYTKVIALQNTLNNFRSKLAKYNNNELLELAFNKGEISLSEYMYELSLYNESMYKLLEMEMNYNLAKVEILHFGL